MVATVCVVGKIWRVQSCWGRGLGLMWMVVRTHGKFTLMPLWFESLSNFIEYDALASSDSLRLWIIDHQSCGRVECITYLVIKMDRIKDLS